MNTKQTKYNVKQGQSLMDVALDHYGTVEGVIDIWLRDHGNQGEEPTYIGLDDVLEIGDVLQVDGGELSNENLSYLTQKGITIATDSDRSQESTATGVFDKTFDNTFG